MEFFRDPESPILFLRGFFILGWIEKFRNFRKIAGIRDFFLRDIPEFFYYSRNRYFFLWMGYPSKKPTLANIKHSNLKKDRLHILAFKK